MSKMDSADVVKCIHPDSVISAVRDSTAFLNAKFVTVMLRVLPEISVIPTLELVFVWRTMQDLAVMFVMKDTTIFQGVQTVVVQEKAHFY